MTEERKCKHCGAVLGKNLSGQPAFICKKCQKANPEGFEDNVAPEEARANVKENLRKRRLN